MIFDQIFVSKIVSTKKKTMIKNPNRQILHQTHFFDWFRVEKNADVAKVRRLFAEFSDGLSEFVHDGSDTVHKFHNTMSQKDRNKSEKRL